MAGLVLRSGEQWMVSRRTFRHLLDDAKVHAVDDAEAVLWLQIGIANDMLDLQLVSTSVAARLESHLRASASRELHSSSDSVTATSSDASARALTDLLGMLRCGDSS